MPMPEAANDEAMWKRRGRRTPVAGPALLAALAVLATLGDPGITVDEPLDVRPGRRYVELLMKHGPAFLSAPIVDRTYRDNAEHPPLGRWLLGIASKLGEPVEATMRGGDPTGLYVRSGRVAPALAFGLLVGVVACAAVRLGGPAAGWGGGLGLLLMPRMFAHAHLGALDTFVALFWTLALFATLRATSARRTLPALAGAGALWGLALLTKIHGWLLAPVALAWIAARLPWRRALAGGIVWLAAGLAVLFAGWPWLWYDGATRLAAFFRGGVERTPILVRYLGATYRDVDVPWHYPWLQAVASVPIGLLALGGFGAWIAARDRRSRPVAVALLGVIAGWLILFSTRVPVYDGERLFLPIFPAWAALVGLGFGGLWEKLGARPGARAVVAALLAAQAYGVVALHPFQLSYYNALVGGLRGAERLGLELTYWGDAVDERLLDDLARRARAGDRVALAPTLAPTQGLTLTTPTLARRELLLGDQEAVPRSRWVVIYRRTPYWTEEIRRLVETAEPVATRVRDGVWLSGIWANDGKSRTSN